MSKKRVFLATPKNFGSDNTEEFKTFVLQKIRAPDGLDLVTAGEEFVKHTGAFAGWQGWSEFVATSIDFNTRQPRYAAIVVPNTVVGKATSDLCAHSLRVGKPVYVRLDEGLKTVVAVDTVNERDFFTGWELRTS